MFFIYALAIAIWVEFLNRYLYRMKILKYMYKNINDIYKCLIRLNFV